jgi:hypothetical protein
MGPPAQANARPPAILLNKFDTSGFDRFPDFLSGILAPTQFAIVGFKSGHSGFGDPGTSR